MRKIWYSEQMSALNHRYTVGPENVSLDLRINILKPLHANWVTQYYDSIKVEIVVKGSRIMDALESTPKKEDPFEN